ncbi:MAG TPA: MarP family serine protease [Acidimicrobiales bacterium]|nr:MarP family serine protease [Acidimicrobiales bacterium]
MNLFDIALILLAVSAALGGYRLGFLARASSWLGLAVGVVAGAVVLPQLLPRIQDTSDATKTIVAVATIVGMALIGQALGLLLGSNLRAELPLGSARRTDQVAGALVGVAGVLVVLWILLPILAHVQGWTAEQARASRIAQEVADTFPNPPDTLEALRRIMGDDPFPQVFDALRPAPDVGTAPGASGLSEETAERVSLSTVKIQGQACGRIQEGSGFFVDDDLVVTNAHVVAGEDDSDVELSDGSTLDADVVAFDPERDLAVLRTEDSDRTPLPVRAASTGDTGGVFGHPGGGPLEISPFRVSDQITATGTDIYDRSRTSREVLVLASELAPGDSGSALVDSSGQVVGVAFAVAPDKPGVAYALAVEELEAVLAGDLSRERDTGGCLV